MTPQRKRTLATLMVVVLAAPAVLVALDVLRRTGAAEPGPPATGPAAGEAVVFTGAPGWVGGRGACTEVRPEDGCDSEWRHDTGQVVRVFVVHVPDPRALEGFVQRLAMDVTKKGGVVDRFTQNGLTLVRFLQAAPAELASINYALVGRDQRALHLITTVVPIAEQEGADTRLRSLLEHAAWVATP